MTLKCDICDYSCAKRSNLPEHITLVHDGVRQFKCEVCEKNFPQKQSLKLHYARIHETKKLTGEICKRKI